ncbi:hypothetical protein DRW03_16665 [Corallococcus sp. H22C18031201]|nr:hypothetical protein DRW03_16665 [Corallococcus sp. H22C18031201]
MTHSVRLRETHLSTAVPHREPRAGPPTPGARPRTRPPPSRRCPCPGATPPASPIHWAPRRLQPRSRPARPAAARRRR